jgi:hypothetical protein
MSAATSGGRQVFLNSLQPHVALLMSRIRREERGLPLRPCEFVIENKSDEDSVLKSVDSRKGQKVYNLVHGNEWSGAPPPFLHNPWNHRVSGNFPARYRP